MVNPTSGRGRARSILGQVTRAIADLGRTVDVTVSTDGEHLRRAVAQARDRGADRVVVCGGDGTLHLAVQELCGSSTALAIIPSGTGDDNARTLGVPRGDAVAAATLAVSGEISLMDLGRVATSQGDERVFLGVLSSGFDSQVNERANRMQWPGGNARYLAAILGELRTFRPVTYRALIDGREAKGEAMLVAVGNGASYGGGMRVCPSADPADGLLEVTWLHGVPRATFLRLFPLVFTGGHVSTRYVSSVRATTVSLEAQDQVAYADGERIGPLPIRVDVLPRALRVVRGMSNA